MLCFGSKFSSQTWVGMQDCYVSDLESAYQNEFRNFVLIYVTRLVD
jgi:hypothetical protein